MFVVFVAAGSGSRMSGAIGERSKTLLPLIDGACSLQLACHAFLEAAPIAGLLVATPPGESAPFRAALANILPEERCAFVDGGATRQESVRLALQALAEAFPAISSDNAVLIHDGARPLVSASDIRAVVDAVAASGAAVIGNPLTNTVKLVASDGSVERTVPRSNLWQVQTPQGFRYGEILAAHERAAREGWAATDDSEIAELAGIRVAMVRGSTANVKLTTPEDIALAQALLLQRRVR